MPLVPLGIMKTIYIALPVIVGMVAFFGWKLTARGAYETAEYKVVEVDGEFEIREYPELTLATTLTRFERQGDDGSFMRLFRYISGENDAKQKVAMTTPVFMRPQSERSSGKMSFVIPKSVAAQGVPQPNSDQVTMHKRAGGRFAVIRFSGRMAAETMQPAEVKLRKWMSRRELRPAAAAETAGYDPPWTPGPLRRNEVLIRLK